MTGNEALREVARRRMRERLDVEARSWGRASLGLIAEGIVAAVREAVAEHVGPEAAYATLQRAADQAAVPLASKPLTIEPKRT